MEGKGKLLARMDSELEEVSRTRIGFVPNP
jgi:hypothetical protein